MFDALIYTRPWWITLDSLHVDVHATEIIFIYAIVVKI